MSGLIVARHEAAHAVTAIWYGQGLSAGIDLDAITSVEGAFGNAAVNMFVPDTSRQDEEQRRDLLQNLVVVCAGAASDAKVTAQDPLVALEAQVGDHAFARLHAPQHPILGADDVDHLIRLALEKAVELVADEDIWTAIDAVAAACVSNGGKLDDADIRTIAMPHLQSAHAKRA